MAQVTRELIEHLQAVRKRKATLLALVRGGHEQPKGMSREEAIKALNADIAECDETIAEILVEEARFQAEIQARFFT